jgi:hypothetical protein
VRATLRASVPNFVEITTATMNREPASALRPHASGVTERDPITEVELLRHNYLLALQRRGIGDAIRRPPGLDGPLERWNFKNAPSLGEPIPGEVHYYTTGPRMLWRVRWGDDTLALHRLDPDGRRWIHDPGLLDRIGGFKPDEYIREIDEAEARRIAHLLLAS